MNAVGTRKARDRIGADVALQMEQIFRGGLAQFGAVERHDIGEMAGVGDEPLDAVGAGPTVDQSCYPSCRGSCCGIRREPCGQYRNEGLGLSRFTYPEDWVPLRLPDPENR